MPTGHPPIDGAPVVLSRAPSARTDTLRGRLLSRMAVDRERIVAAAWRSMVAVESNYATLIDSQATEVRGTVAFVFDQVVSNLADGRGLTVDELDSIAEVGRVHARHGVPLGTAQRGLRLAFESFYRQLLVAAEMEEPGPVRLGVIGDFSVRLAELAFDVSEAISSSYGQRTNAPALNDRQEAAHVETILCGGWMHDELRRAAEHSGQQVRAPAALILLVPTDRATVSDVRSLAARLSDAIPAGLLGRARTRPCPHAVMVVGALGDSELARLRRRLRRFGQTHGASVLVVHAPTLRALGNEYRPLREYVSLVPVVAAEDVLASADELRMYKVLAACNKSAAAAFVRDTLGPILILPAKQRDLLIDTLRALQGGDGSIKQAASQLDLSAKGAGYRNGRIAELTGLSPTKPSDRFRLDLATHLLRIWPSLVRVEDAPADFDDVLASDG